MALPRIETLLSTDSEMQPVVAKAREINALASLCNEFLPPELAAQVRPANLQGDKLVGPVNDVQINDISLQPLQATFQLAQDVNR